LMCESLLESGHQVSGRYELLNLRWILTANIIEHAKWLRSYFCNIERNEVDSV
jgi:hypothetical protein